MNFATQIKIISVCLLANCTARAATTDFTSQAAFVANLAPGYYFQDFTSLAEFNTAPYYNLSFTGGTPAVSYTVNATPGGLYANGNPDPAIGNWSSTDPVIINFNSGNVFDVGANFFGLDTSANRTTTPITVTFSDGTTASVPGFTAGAYGFFGVASSSPITSLTVSPNANFVNIGSLYVSGALVPEPSACAIISLAGGWLVLKRQRNRKRC